MQKASINKLTTDNHVLITASNWISRLISMCIQFFSIPILLNSLGTVQFAQYVVIASLISWYQLCDLGFGSGLQNQIIKSKYNKNSLNHLITTTAIIGIGTFIICSCLLYFLSPAITNFIFTDSEISGNKTLIMVVNISGVFFLGNMLLSYSQKVFYALGYGFYANFISGITNIIFIVLIIYYESKLSQDYKLIAFIIFYSAPIGISGVISVIFLGAIYWSWSYKEFCNQILLVWKNSSKFWIISILSMLVLNVEYIIMSRLVNPEEIVSYNVLYRIFWIIISFYSGLLASSWGVFSRLSFDKRWQEIYKKIHCYILLGIVATCILGLLILIYSETIILIISNKKNIQIITSTVLFFALYIVIRIWTDTYTVVLQSISDLNYQLFITPIQALMSVGGQIYFIKIFGINGVLIGLILSFILTGAWIQPLRLRYIMLKKV